MADALVLNATVGLGSTATGPQSAPSRAATYQGTELITSIEHDRSTRTSDQDSIAEDERS